MLKIMNGTFVKTDEFIHKMTLLIEYYIYCLIECNY